jgi:SET domain-containing protein
MDWSDNTQYVPEAALHNTAVRKPVLVSTREIEEGEEITFDYNITESTLAHPFICNCCGKEIKGKSYE